MSRRKVLRRYAAICSVAICTGCGVPHYDIPYDHYNQPTAKTIVQRLQCEIRDMVRDDQPDEPATFNRLWLLDGDFDVQVALSLEVNDSGGLAPSVSFMGDVNGFRRPSTYTLGTTGNLSEARDHTFNENIQISVRQIYMDWKSGYKPYDCPAADSNLSGTLGIKDLVALAASTPSLVDPLPSAPATPAKPPKSSTPSTASAASASSSASVFGGSIQFVVTKTISSTGPTFALVHFKSISMLGNLSEINTDKLTLSFAHGPNLGKKMPPITHVVRARGYTPNGFNPSAYNFLQQQITSSITGQLIILQKSLSP